MFSRHFPISYASAQIQGRGLAYNFHNAQKAYRWNNGHIPQNMTKKEISVKGGHFLPIPQTPVKAFTQVQNELNNPVFWRPLMGLNRWLLSVHSAWHCFIFFMEHADGGIMHDFPQIWGCM